MSRSDWKTVSSRPRSTAFSSFRHGAWGGNESTEEKDGRLGGKLNRMLQLVHASLIWTLDKKCNTKGTFEGWWSDLYRSTLDLTSFSLCVIVKLSGSKKGGPETFRMSSRDGWGVGGTWRLCKRGLIRNELKDSYPVLVLKARVSWGLSGGKLSIEMNSPTFSISSLCEGCGPANTTEDNAEMRDGRWNKGSFLELCRIKWSRFQFCYSPRLCLTQ